MEIPTIHCCNMLTMQNEILSRKYQKLTKKYKLLEKQFLDLKETLIHERATKDILEVLERTEANPEHITKKEELSREQMVRSHDLKTEKAKQRKNQPQGHVIRTDIESHSNKKLLSLHNELIKKYEKEIKVNRRRVEQVAKLALEKSELRQELNSKESEIYELKKQLDSKERQLKTQATTLRHSPQVSGLRKKLSVVETMKKKLEDENNRLKDELSGLDKGFFDEVEDLKYALHKSAALNKEYEKALRNMCKKFDVDYKSVRVKTKKLPRRKLEQTETLYG